VEAFNKNGALSSQTHSAYQQSLLRATRAFNGFLHFIAQKLFSKIEVADRTSKSSNPKDNTEPTFQVSEARVSRRAWFFYEKEVVKHRDSLRQARESLHTALTVANTYALLLYGIEARLIN
jgi:hypothetical protein